MPPTPPRDASLRDQLAYLVRRFDDHLDDHADDLKEALRSARRAPYDRLLLYATLVMSAASVASVLLTHH